MYILLKSLLHQARLFTANVKIFLAEDTPEEATKAQAYFGKAYQTIEAISKTAVPKASDVSPLPYKVKGHVTTVILLQVGQDIRLGGFSQGGIKGVSKTSLQDFRPSAAYAVIATAAGVILRILKRLTTLRTTFGRKRELV